MKYLKLFEDATKSPETEVTERIDELLKPARTAAKQAAKVLNFEPIIDKFKSFLISSIPAQIQTAKTGKGGSTFAYQCYLKLSELIDATLKEIPGWKKTAINIAAPSRNEFREKSKNLNQYSLYFDNFEMMIDFAYIIGARPEFYDKYQDQMGNYSKQVSDWLEKNKQPIISALSNKIETFIYGPTK